MAINGYVTRRINSDISMKVACDPNEWMTYYDTTGILAENVHDYGVIELDNSLQIYTEQLKKQYYKKY